MYSFGGMEGVCIDNFYFLCEVRPLVNCSEEEAESEVELRWVENSCLRNVMRWPENEENLHKVADWKPCYYPFASTSFPEPFDNPNVGSKKGY